MSDNPIQFRFDDIEILSKNVVYKPFDSEKEFRYYYQVTADSKVNISQGLVLVLVHTVIKSAEHETLASFNAVFTFEIVDFEKNIPKIGEGLYHVPDALNDMFKQVSISTMRGIIYSELRGTYLHAAIMPVIFPPNSPNDNGSDTPPDFTEDIKAQEKSAG